MHYYRIYISLPRWAFPEWKLTQAFSYRLSQLGLTWNSLTKHNENQKNITQHIFKKYAHSICITSSFAILHKIENMMKVALWDTNTLIDRSKICQYFKYQWWHRDTTCILKINNNIKPTLDIQRDPASNRKKGHWLTDRIKILQFMT